MTRELSEKEQKEFLDWWADSALTVTIALNTQKTVKPSYILAYAAALDSPAVRELREAVKVLRSALEWCRGVAAAGGKTLAENEPIKSALTDTAPLAAKIRQEIVDEALEASAKAVEDIFDQYFVQGVAYEIRAMKGKPL